MSVPATPALTRPVTAPTPAGPPPTTTARYRRRPSDPSPPAAASTGGSVGTAAAAASTGPAAISVPGPHLVTECSGVALAAAIIRAVGTRQWKPWHRPVIARVRRFTASRVRGKSSESNASSISPAETCSQEQTTSPYAGRIESPGSSWGRPPTSPDLVADHHPGIALAGRLLVAAGSRLSSSPCSVTSPATSRRARAGEAVKPVERQPVTVVSPAPPSLYRMV